MPTNLYFDFFHNKAEQDLYDELINETVQIYGIDTYYMPRTSESGFDLLFGEDPTSKFTEAYPVEVYVQSVDEFEGGELFSKFGLEVKKQARFLVTKMSFGKNVPSTYNRPQEGDLLWMTNFKALFEIKYVDEEHFFYTFGNNKIYGYSLVCEKFRYSNERVNTDVPHIDDHVDEIVPAFDFFMNTAAPHTSTYQQGELVTQATTNANAVVVVWNVPTGILTLKHINGTFANGINIVGQTTQASYMLANNEIREDVNKPLADNLRLATGANTILNWNENNPFGEPS